MQAPISYKEQPTGFWSPIVLTEVLLHCLNMRVDEDIDGRPYYYLSVPLLLDLPLPQRI